MNTDLWNFAVNLYARPGVEAACLNLQDQGGNVCLLLCGAWLETRGVKPDATRVEHLQQLAEPWHRQVVTPLRVLRQQWRKAASVDPAQARLREQLKALELTAERELLERLQTASLVWPVAEVTVSDWLERLAPDGVTAYRDALHKLRVAAAGTQDAVDGD